MFSAGRAGILIAVGKARQRSDTDQGKDETGADTGRNQKVGPPLAVTEIGQDRLHMRSGYPARSAREAER